jgi:hypothetical protein
MANRLAPFRLGYVRVKKVTYNLSFSTNFYNMSFSTNFDNVSFLKNATKCHSETWHSATWFLTKKNRSTPKNGYIQRWLQELLSRCCFYPCFLSTYVHNDTKCMLCMHIWFLLCSTTSYSSVDYFQEYQSLIKVVTCIKISYQNKKFLPTTIVFTYNMFLHIYESLIYIQNSYLQNNSYIGTSNVLTHNKSSYLRNPEIYSCIKLLCLHTSVPP